MVFIDHPYKAGSVLQGLQLLVLFVVTKTLTDVLGALIDEDAEVHSS